MSRNTTVRSVSFDAEIFSKMEDRRGALMMDRSEYIKRCIIKDMISGGALNIDEVPKGTFGSPAAAPKPKRK